MADDIRALSAQLAQDPQSLVFLRLGEALRRKGQLEAALRVAMNGLERHPHLADAHDLYARILTDKRERRVIYLLYHCGLKPREIVLRCPGEFTNEQEVYRLRCNGLDRLKRHQDTLLHRLGWKFDGCTGRNHSV